MIAWGLVCAVIGCIVGAITQLSILGWAAGIGLFVIGLPGALIGGFIFDIGAYHQDRADQRQIMAEIAEECRLEDMERAADRRVDRIINAGRKPSTYVDNRQVNIYGGGQ